MLPRGKPWSPAMGPWSNKQLDKKIPGLANKVEVQRRLRIWTSVSFLCEVWQRCFRMSPLWTGFKWWRCYNTSALPALCLMVSSLITSWNVFQVFNSDLGLWIYTKCGSICAPASSWLGWYFGVWWCQYRGQTITWWQTPSWKDPSTPKWPGVHRGIKLTHVLERTNTLQQKSFWDVPQSSSCSWCLHTYTLSSCWKKPLADSGASVQPRNQTKNQRENPWRTTFPENRSIRNKLDFKLAWH